MINLKNKNAVVTGAGSGIGAAVAELFFTLGCNVSLIGKSEYNVKSISERLDKDLKMLSYFSCDVGNESSLSEVRDLIIKDKGQIDILVTCAAAPGSAGHLRCTAQTEI